MQLIPYLTFDGTCADAMEFYAELFGGQIEMMQLVKDSPMASEMPPEAQDRVLHARLSFGGDQRLMASDSLIGQYEAPQGITVSASFDDADKASRVFSRLAKHGTVRMPFAPTFWSPGFGYCTDRYGIPWMIDCSAADQS